MVLLIIVAIIVLVVLYFMGFFDKTTKCEHCGKEIKGLQQEHFYGEKPFVICKECAKKIHPRVFNKS